MRPLAARAGAFVLGEACDQAPDEVHGLVRPLQGAARIASREAIGPQPDERAQLGQPCSRLAGGLERA